MAETHDEYRELADIWDGRRLTVPPYQRRYAWKKEHVNDLIRDLNYVRKESDREDSGARVEHYFGTIVLDAEGDLTDLPDMAPQTWTEMNIVDGQQRIVSVTILVACLVEIIEALVPRLEMDEAEMAEASAEEITETFIEQYHTSRVDISSDDDSEVFRDLVYNSESPEALRDINNYTLPSQQRLLRTKELFRDWLIEDILIDDILGGRDNIREKYEAIKNNETGVIEDPDVNADGPLQVLDEIDADEAQAYIEEIASVQNFVSEHLVITEYNIERSSKAGRLFQSINDRGRDLILADRIKSYLVYLTDRLDEPSLAESVFLTFADIADTITRYGDEETIDSFIRAHWRMWSGETRYTRSNRYSDSPQDIHRRVKQLEKHAALTRGDNEITRWIRAYIDDLDKSAKAYQRVMYPEEFDPGDYSDLGGEFKRHLEGIHRCSSAENVDALLMAIYRLYAKSPPVLDAEQVTQIVELLQKMAFRVYGAADRKANVRRDKYRDLSHQLRWTGESAELRRIFETDGTYQGTIDVDIDEIFSDGSEAFVRTCRAIENAIGNYGYDALFLDGLRHDDLFDGNRSADKWGGMSKDTIRHFFWEYEYYCRGDNLEDMPSLQDIAQKSRDIEHIWAQNPAESLPDELNEEHNQYVNSLGNLGLLHYTDNREHQDDSYDLNRHRRG